MAQATTSDSAAGRTTSCDVAIVGAGPTGLTLAMLLGRQGVSSTVLERRDGLIDHPRAHFVNTRTMELLTVWGLADAVRKEAYPSDHLPFEQLVALGGPSNAERDELAPARLTSCAQDRIEEILVRAVSETPEAEIVWNADVTGVDDLGGSVVVHAEGGDGPIAVAARWVVACDGAASGIRTSLGVEMIGDDDLGSLINIYFEGRITPPGEVPSLAGQSTNPDAPGAYISMDGDRRFCFHHNYDPALESPADFDEGRCADIVTTALGDTADGIAIKSIRPWRMTALVAERMRIGNVFLAGDAAHAFPPTGGFGMNSGIQDAHNLAWKLAAAVRGDAGEALLESYESERQPVAFLNTAQSLRNRELLQPGTSPFEAVLDERATRSVYSGAARATDDAERGRLQMLEHVAATGQDLGYAYLDSPVISPDGRPRPDIQVAFYVPNACPGSRTPHVVVNRDGAKRPLHALLDGSFSMIVLDDGAAWVEAASSLATTIEVLQLGGAHGLPVDGDVDLVELFGIGADGVLLVRPDGFVTFRSEHRVDDAVAVLSNAVDTALGRRSV